MQFSFLNRAYRHYIHRLVRSMRNNWCCTIGNDSYSYSECTFLLPPLRRLSAIDIDIRSHNGSILEAHRKIQPLVFRHDDKFTASAKGHNSDIMYARYRNAWE